MTLDAAEIKRVIEDGDESRVRDLLAGATEAERRACAKELEEFLFGVEAFERHAHGLDQVPAFAVAAVGLAKGAAPAYRAWEWVDMARTHGARLRSDLDAIVGVLADRNPSWLPQFTDRLLRAEWEREMYWQIVRDLVILGLIGKPERPEYTTAMVGGLYAWRTEGGERPLRADPGLLDDEVWRLFTVPEAGAALDRREDGIWSDELVTLTWDGTISRDRLLDECLNAFLRDFPPNHVGWYLSLHDRLEPSGAEKAARSGTYLALLSAISKTGVTLGQRECRSLLEEGLLDPRAFLAASANALLFSVKLVVTAHLKLIDALIKAHPGLRDEALATVAIAFGHEREDLQAAALKLIGKHGVPVGGPARETIERLAAALSPVIVPDAVALGLMPEPEPPAASPGSVPEASAGPAVVPPAEAVAAARVRPLEDPDELVQSLARLMEDASDVLEAERVVAGAVRLASLPLAERARIAAPLLKRAGEHTVWPHVNWVTHGAAFHLSYLVIVWAKGDLNVQVYSDWMNRHDDVRFSPRPVWDMADWDPVDPRHGVLGSRVWEACQLVLNGPGGPLLAEPEFTDGTIGHETLLRRLASWRPGSGGPPRNDLEAALLRLPPGAGDGFWAEWNAAPVVAAGETPSAAEARAMYDDGHAPLEFEPVYAPEGMGRRGGPLPRTRGRLTTPGTADSRSRCWRVLTSGPATAPRFVYGQYHARHYGRELPLLLPHQPELAAANLLLLLCAGFGISGDATERALKALPGVGALPGRVLGRMGHLLLVTRLASADPDTRVEAASSWAGADAGGRLDPGLAAETITDGVCAGEFMPRRIAESLAQAALDPAAVASVVAVCLASSAALLPSRPRDLHLLLELATRCLATAPGRPAIPAAIEDLARSGKTTKLAEAARRLARPR